LTEDKTLEKPAGSNIEDNDEIMTSSTSIIIDLEGLSESAPPRVFEPDAIQSRPMERVTFSNLEALVPDKVKPPSAEHLVEPTPAVATPPADAVSIHEVKPPSLFRFVSMFVLIVAVAVVGFVGWKMDWQWSHIIDDPNGTAQVILRGRSVQKATDTPVGVETQPLQIAPETGQLETGPIAVTMVDGVGQVSGELKNASNRIHRSIDMVVRLTDARKKQLFFSKKVRCCAPSTDTVVLRPGEATSFQIPVDLKGRTVDNIEPAIEVKFSMTDVPE